MKSVHSHKEMHCYGNLNSNQFGNQVLEWYGSVCETGEPFLALKSIMPG